MLPKIIQEVRLWHLLYNAAHATRAHSAAAPLRTTILRRRMISDMRLPTPHPATAIRNMRSIAALYAALTSALSAAPSVDIVSMLESTALRVSADSVGACSVSCVRSCEEKMPPAMLDVRCRQWPRLRQGRQRREGDAR